MRGRGRRIPLIIPKTKIPSLFQDEGIPYTENVEYEIPIDPRESILRTRPEREEIKYILIQNPNKTIVGIVDVKLSGDEVPVDFRLMPLEEIEQQKKVQNSDLQPAEFLLQETISKELFERKNEESEIEQRRWYPFTVEYDEINERLAFSYTNRTFAEEQVDTYQNAHFVKYACPACNLKEESAENGIIPYEQHMRRMISGQLENIVNATYYVAIRTSPSSRPVLQDSLIMKAMCSNSGVLLGLICIGAGFIFPGMWGYGSMIIGSGLVASRCCFFNERREPIRLEDEFSERPSPSTSPSSTNQKRH